MGSGSTRQKSIFQERDPLVPLEEVILPPETERRIQRVLAETRKADLLIRRGLLPSRRLLFHGFPGTGKTYGAEAIAFELERPFFVFNLEVIASSGAESGLKMLAEGFDQIESLPGVYLFDEFEAIASQRDIEKSTDESRQIVNDLLIRMDTYTGTSITICATNYIKAVDGAFRRRFDVICQFNAPDEHDRKKIIVRTLEKYGFSPREIELKAMVEATKGLSLDECKASATNAIKTTIIEEKETIQLSSEIQSITERKYTFSHLQ